MTRSCVLRTFIFCMVIGCKASDVTDFGTGYAAVRGISDAGVQAFDSSVQSIMRSIALGWSETLIYSQLVVGFLVASDPFPSRSSFETFIGGDPLFNPDKIIHRVQWVPKVDNSARRKFEADVQRDISDFKIFLFTGPSNNETSAVLPENASVEYNPITYASPEGYNDDMILGYDLYNDPYQGQYIRKIRSTGLPAAASPFALRGLLPTNSSQMGMTVYMPLFKESDSGTILTTSRTPYYFGCTCTVFRFQPILQAMLQNVYLDNTDVFLFARAKGADGSNVSVYVGHYESGPDATKPALTPADIAKIQPEDITGDIVTVFNPPFSSAYDITMVDQRFRVLVRARKGSIPKDVLVFNSSKRRTYQPCAKMTTCAEGEQGSPLVLTVEDSQQREITFKTSGTNYSFCEPRYSLLCNINITEPKQGILILEIFASGKQIENSPLLISVTSRHCKEGFAVSSVDGLCACPAGTQQAFGGCIALSIVIPSVILTLVVVFGAVYYVQAFKDDEDYAVIRNEMARLRNELKLTRRYGFLLSSEWYPSIWEGSANGDAVVIQTKYLESVASLSLLREDFDIKNFDSFCVCLNEKPVQYQNLRVLLLAICKALLDPFDRKLDEECSRSSFGKLRKALSGSAIHTGTVRRAFSGSSIHSGPVQSEVGVQNGLGMTPEERFLYFRTKIVKLRIWVDEGKSLFRELKDVAQTLMDKVATRYDERFCQFCCEPGGAQLSGLPTDIVPTPKLFGFVICRQDHEQVSAIRVDEISKREAELEGKYLPRRSVSEDEELFLAQLHCRAKLLDHTFLQKIISVVKNYEALGGSIQEFRRTSSGAIGPRRESVTNMYDLQSCTVMQCKFEEGNSRVEIHSAPIKTVARMQEKLMEYQTPDGVWPLSANILDPVRVSIVCHGPSQVLQILGWFQDFEGETGLPLCRIKNKFSLEGTDGDYGYRDLKIFVLFTDVSELRIIGEVQIHDKAFYDNKHRTHRLYKIIRAHRLDMV